MTDGASRSPVRTGSRVSHLLRPNKVGEPRFEIHRGRYARMYGSPVGDRVHLGDTNLLVEVERDDASPGDETLSGFRTRQRLLMRRVGENADGRIG
jgi:hypothetical protein